MVTSEQDCGTSFSRTDWRLGPGDFSLSSPEAQTDAHQPAIGLGACFVANLPPQIPPSAGRHFFRLFQFLGCRVSLVLEDLRGLAFRIPAPTVVSTLPPWQKRTLRHLSRSTHITAYALLSSSLPGMISKISLTERIPCRMALWSSQHRSTLQDLRILVQRAISPRRRYS